jgi:hypothetical protein
VIAPGVSAAPSAARLPALIRGNRRCGIRLTRQPLRLDMLHMVGDGGGFLLLGHGIGVALLPGQLARMHHDKAQFRLGDSSVTVLDLHLAEHTVPMLTARRLVLCPSGFLH